MRAAIYTRVSTEEQVESGYSLAEQKEACLQKAKEWGAQTIKVYTDEGVSGSTLDRPALNALRRDVREGRIDRVLCRDPDRLSRKLAHQLLLTEELEKAGVRLEFLSFDWKDTPEGRLFYAVRGAIAEYEREKIRERTTLGKIQKAREGGVPVRFDVYGYHYNSQSGQVTVEESEAVVVRNIFEHFITGAGYNAIARQLNEAGVPTKHRKGAWHRQTVAQIIKNTVYKGTWYYRKADYKGGRPGRPLPPGGREGWIPVPVPAIIPEDLWRSAQEKTEEARRLRASCGKHDYLLSGIISCRDCGGTMCGTWTAFWGKYNRYYTCQKRTEGKKYPGCKPRKMVLAWLIESRVWEQVKGWLTDPEALAEEAWADWPGREELEGAQEQFEKLLKEAEQGRENILTALASGLFELDARTKRVLTDLKQRIEKLARKKTEIEAALTHFRKVEPGPGTLKTAGTKLLGQLDDLVFGEKRNLVRALVKQVVVAGRPGAGEIKITVIPQVPDVAAKTSFPREA